MQNKDYGVKYFQICKAKSENKSNFEIPQKKQQGVTDV